MTPLAKEDVQIIGSIDTHIDTTHVATIDTVGRVLGDREFPHQPRGS